MSGDSNTRSVVGLPLLHFNELYKIALEAIVMRNLWSHILQHHKCVRQDNNKVFKKHFILYKSWEVTKMGT